MKHIFINNYRRNKKRSTIIDSTADVTLLSNARIHAANQGESNLAVENVNQAVTLLSEDFRKPFLMHYQGYKYHEIADQLTLPIGTVKSRIHFARKELKKKINRY